MAGGEVMVEGFDGGFSSRPFFDKLNFGTQFDETQRLPLNIGEVFDPGTTTLYAYWLYQDMVAGTPYQVTWYHDGEPFSTFKGVFDAPRGMGWAKANRQDGMPLEPGGYQAVVEVSGEAVLGTGCVVQDVPEDPKEFGPLLLATALDEAEQPVDPGVYFHYGVTELYSHWPYRDVNPGTNYRYTWYKNGDVLAENESVLKKAQDSAWQRLRNVDRMPLSPGPYEISVWVGGSRELYAACYIADTETESYGPVVFSSEFDDESQDPVSIGTRFDYGIPKLYGYWAFRNAPVGTPYAYAWYRDGVRVTSGEDMFDWPAGRSWQSVLNDDGTPLEKGTYTFNVTVNDAVVVADQCVIE